MWRRGFLSNRYYAYPGVQDPAVPFISDAMVESRLWGLNSAMGKRLLEDKNAFADALAARGLASAGPEVYGTVSGGAFHARSPAAAEQMRAQDTVVVKPVSGAGGRGVRMVAGAAVEPLVPDVHDELIVQQRLRQHPDLAAIYPASLNTIRVLAIRLPDAGPVIAAAVHRWGTVASGDVDNVSSGGLCSAVDLADGQLGPAVGRPRRRRRVQYDRHPDTGVRITGVPVPRWAEVRELVLGLMDAFPEVDHVGWDMCATDTGPAVVEGNAGVPNLNVFQFHGSFLQDPHVRRYYLSHGLLDAGYA